LYAIADSALLSGTRLTHGVAQAITGGAAVIQYRDKGADPRRRHTQALALAQLCRVYDVPLIINDDMLLARTAGAAGVHLGRGDPSVAAARKLLGHDAIIGVSCYNNPKRFGRTPACCVRPKHNSNAPSWPSAASPRTMQRR
jgi:thiamine-phosphate pyrophosphorylase